MQPFVRALLAGFGYRMGTELARRLCDRLEKKRARARSKAEDDEPASPEPTPSPAGSA